MMTQDSTTTIKVPTGGQVRTTNSNLVACKRVNYSCLPWCVSGCRLENPP
jgi:hypothetical protein